MSTRHGTGVTYREGCHCTTCRRAIALEHNLYKLRVAGNGGQPLSVSKIGAVRRLHALMALGWPRRELARRAGYQGDAFALVLNGRRERLFLTTHERIAALYEELCMTPGPSDRTRRYAASRGWAPPLAWDDIDTDPGPADAVDVPSRRDDVDPVVVERILAGERLPATRAERELVVASWLETGRSWKELVALTGWKPERYITRPEDLEESA